uniref:Ig-like domain-containing protein n=1 Tax=Callorhinchus milii TaxID=7868 RepID=A0A4W3GU56_CALMI
MFITEICDGDSVSQKAATTVKIEGQSEVIECTYSTTVGYYYLFWYRHYPDQQPEFIFRSYSNRDNPVKGPGFGNRFTAVLHKSISFTGLTISELVLSDSAVYYCAFSLTTVINCTARLVQKLP